MDQSLSIVVRIDQGPSGVEVQTDRSLNLNEHALGEGGRNRFRSSSSSGGGSSSNSSCSISTVVVTEIIQSSFGK